MLCYLGIDYIVNKDFTMKSLRQEIIEALLDAKISYFQIIGDASSYEFIFEYRGCDFTIRPIGSDVLRYSANIYGIGRYSDMSVEHSLRDIEPALELMVDRVIEAIEVDI